MKYGAIENNIDVSSKNAFIVPIIYRRKREMELCRIIIEKAPLYREKSGFI